ncbi:MAG TPA: prolipoprotein diacylglyceryl transferase [Phycisphaerales bacterium]|nr:prolipoprotein diacylglyceryl transferase [Phycisphaerales bacterium]
MTLAAWFHTLSPFAVRFGPDLGIRWYGLAYLAGFAVAYFAMRAMSRRALIAIPYDRVGDALLWLIGGALIGGRIGYALFYDPRLLYTFSDHFPFWSLLAINEGGMASHGGIAGTIIAAWRISRGFRDSTGAIVGRTSFMHVCDAMALVAPAGLMFGRLANFVNGELLGKIVAKPGEASPWWAVQYPQEIDLCATDRLGNTSPGPDLVQTPEQWQKILDLARPLAPDNTIEGLRVGVHRLAHEGWKHVEQLRPLISARHPSQLYQGAAEGLILGAVLWIVWAKPRKPGVIGAIFLIAYGILRILTELIRLPDAQLAVRRILGLSRGQWLSVAMIAVGLWVLVYATRRAAPKMGGWLRPART